MKKVRVEESIGLVLAYDITEIDQIKGKKGRAFKRGHIIEEKDIEYMKNLGRKHIFVEDGRMNEIHEDDVDIKFTQCKGLHSLELVATMNLEALKVHKRWLGGP